MPDSADSLVHRYHDRTKHHFQRFAASLGYLDWASQPSPFRAYDGAPEVRLYPDPHGAGGEYVPPGSRYAEVFGAPRPPPPLGAGLLGDVLRHALGLSAWKQYGASRWSLRVNPSSGNLHPTEAYVVCGGLPGLWDEPAVYHYRAERHALERRCTFATEEWVSACSGDPDVALIVLSSIHWREAWKYGERAFRYCQHDLGHAIAALRVAAAMVGWTMPVLPTWAQREVGTLAGLDRADDFTGAEREEPGCLMALVGRTVPPAIMKGAGPLLEAVGRGRWTGRASRLSREHVEWPIIDEVARATEDPGRAPPGRARGAAAPRQATGGHDRPARDVVLARRSAVAFDGRSTIDQATARALLLGCLPDSGPPWDALWWPPSIHLALFVHRVDGLDPGLYLLPRTPEAGPALREAMQRAFLWEPVDQWAPLRRLARGDCRGLARRLSCDQDIASDGFFSLGMLARFDEGLEAWGPSFYRHLYWEAGAIGHVLYLEAEAAGVSATGIGCFYDDPVHAVLGLIGHGYQSLYHFTVGVAVEDRRLTTAPGYEWELRRGGESASMDGSLRNSSQA